MEDNQGSNEDVVVEEDQDMEEDEDQDSDDEDESKEDEDEDEDGQAFIPGSRSLEEGEELVMDERAYVLYHQAHLGPPCLSFDVLEDTGGGGDEYPLSVYGVAGTQAAKAGANGIITFKMFNLHPIRHRGEESDDEDDEPNEEEDPELVPKLKVASIKHAGAVNRVRVKALGSTVVAAAWGENGTVGMHSLNSCLQKLEQPVTAQDGRAEWHRESSAPLFEFRGHLTEGFAMNWSNVEAGVFASGDCRKNVHLWRPAEGGSWAVDQRPLVGHTDSVEDIQWSPNEANVLSSCSVDKSIRVWDCRARPDKACKITVADAHESDVNVIDWNAREPFIVSGGDDGFLKIWDLRTITSGEPVATFKHHAGPVTSVEWHHADATVLASSGADDQIALWDLAIEKDDQQENEQQELKDLPPQLLFIHQGLKDIKEIHWHKQIPGLVLSTSHSGFDVFKTISV